MTETNQTVASEIQRIQNAKAAIKTSIEWKWVAVPSSAKLDTYSTYIDQIEQWWELGSVIEYIRDQWWVQINQKYETIRTYHSQYNGNVCVPNNRVFNWWTVLWYACSYQHNSWWWYAEEVRAIWYKNWIFRYLSTHHSQNQNTNTAYWWTADDWYLWHKYTNNYWSWYYKFDFENNQVIEYSYPTQEDPAVPSWYQDSCTFWTWTISTTIMSWDIEVVWKLDYDNNQWANVLWYFQ